MAKYAVSERTHDAIILATGELIAELGFANVSIRAIARRSGVNIGSIHYHFKSKDKLFEAVVRRVVEWMLTNHLQGLLDDHELETPMGRSRAVRKLISSHLSGITDTAREPWYGRVVFKTLEYGSPLLDIIEQEYVTKLTAVFFELFELCDPGCSTQRKHMLFNLLMGPILSHANYPDAFQRFMGVEEFSATYMAELEDAMVKQALFLLGLPQDKEDEA